MLVNSSVLFFPFYVNYLPAVRGLWVRLSSLTTLIFKEILESLSSKLRDQLSLSAMEVLLYSYAIYVHI